MPGWNEVYNEILSARDPFKAVRQKYLQSLSQKMGKNVIAYYSGWLQKPGFSASSINETDKNAFMSVIHGRDKDKGLVLLLHTPGGDLCACESLMEYLKMMFGKDIIMVVPQIAMSAGTLMCCAGSKIIMGKESSLGPIDPQIGGIPAQGILDEFKQAAEEIKKDPTKAYAWQPILGKYNPSLLGECDKAISLASEICSQWLQDNMLSDNKNKVNLSKKITENLSSHEDSKTHSRRFSISKCKDFGLKIEELEKDSELQDLVLTLHHAYMHTFSSTDSLKIVENNKGVDITTRALRQTV